MRMRFILFTPVVLLVACVSHPLQLGFSEQEWQAMPEQQRQQLWENHQKVMASNKKQQQTVYAGPELSLYLLKGSAMMPPFTKRYAFQTFEFHLRPGRCQSVTLKSVDTTHQVNLQMCYNGLKLAIDPSPYNLAAKRGSLFIDYNPVWRRGFTYSNINTQGYARLKNASITVKAISAYESKPHDHSARA